MTLQELARCIGGTPDTSADTELTGLATLESARGGELSFLPHPGIRRHLRLCTASAVIVAPQDAAACPVAVIVVEDPLVGCARAGARLPLVTRETIAARRPAQPYECVDPSASVHPSASIGNAVTVGHGSVVGPGCVIGDGVRIGSYCTLRPNVTIEAAATIGNRVEIAAGVHLGGQPFLYVRDGRGWLQLPAFGSVDIGDDVALGSHVAIDRGAQGDTVVGRGSKIDNHVHIGHGVVLCADVAIAAGTVIAGEAKIGSGCIIGGAVAIAEGVEIAPRVTVTAMSMVTKSIDEAGVRYSSGWPARRSSQWWRFVAALSKRPARHKV